jgi:RNA polymerase sigma-70 factor (ECF subfamily)
MHGKTNLFTFVSLNHTLLETGEHISDRNLIESLQKGDLEAYDSIFRKYGSRLYGFALKYLRSEEEAEELVQDVFLKVWENRKNLKGESLQAYLFTLSYHNMCRLFRKRTCHEKLVKELTDTSSGSFTIEEKIDYQSVLEQVDQLIEKLPPRQKTIFIKSRKEGKSTKEIAAELDLVPGTVDNQISEALKFIRKHLGNNFALLLFFSFFLK